MNGLTEFSGGYFAADLCAEEYDDGPVVAKQLYDYIEENIYEEADVSPWFTDGDCVGEPYFPVSPEAGLPSDVIGLPKEYMENLGIESDFKPRMFLIVKPSFAAFLSRSILLGMRFGATEDSESV